MSVGNPDQNAYVYVIFPSLLEQGPSKQSSLLVRLVGGTPTIKFYVVQIGRTDSYLRKVAHLERYGRKSLTSSTAYARASVAPSPAMIFWALTEGWFVQRGCVHNSIFPGQFTFLPPPLSLPTPLFFPL